VKELLTDVCHDQTINAARLALSVRCQSETHLLSAYSYLCQRRYLSRCQPNNLTYTTGASRVIADRELALSRRLAIQVAAWRSTWSRLASPSQARANCHANRMQDDKWPRRRKRRQNYPP
jgi:hypothetical protein